MMAERRRRAGRSRAVHILTILRSPGIATRSWQLTSTGDVVSLAIARESAIPPSLVRSADAPSAKSSAKIGDS